VLPVGWLILAVVAAIVLTLWFTFTLTRLDRLHARVDAASAALDAQLVRRAAALLHVAEAPDSGLSDELRVQYERTATRALAADDSHPGRQEAENAVGRAVRQLGEDRFGLTAEAAAELHEAAARVLIARRFYNDAVRDTRSLRGRRLPRILHMAGHRGMPEFFDIDDTPPAASPPPALPAHAPTEEESV
jgi:hypothetical protein